MHRVIPDANVIMHFRRLDELDWAALARPGPVVIVITYKLVRELDKQKSQHPIPAIRKRIRDRQRWLLERRRDGGRLSDRVTLAFRIRPPDLDFAQHGLDPRIPDDHYVAAALKEQADHPDDTVLVLTDDMGLELNASERHFAVVRPDQSDRLPSGQDETERLRRENEQLRNRIPAIEIGLADAEGPLLEVPFLRHTPLPEARLDEENARYAASHPKLDLDTRKSPPQTDPTGIRLRLPLSDLSFSRLSREACMHYNTQLDEHFAQHRRFLDRREAFREVYSRLVPITLVLSNTGSAPAEDVDLTIELPADCLAMVIDQLPEEPAPPEPPVKPSNVPATIQPVPPFRSYRDILSHIAPNIPDFDETRPYVDGDHEAPRIVEFHFNRLKQNTAIELRPFYVVVGDAVAPGANLPLLCTLNSASVPKLVSRTLTIGLRPPPAHPAPA